MEDENLKNGIDDFMEHLKSLIEKQDLNSIPGLSDDAKEQFRTLIDDFDELKDEMKVEIYKLDPEQQQKLAALLQQINSKNFTEPIFNTNQSTAPATPPVNKEKQLTDIPGTTENLQAKINAIDNQLRNPNLSDEEINRLLDERTAISSELKQLA